MLVKKFFNKFASWHLWLNLLGMVVVIIMLFVGLKWWLLSYTHHGEGIEVPDLYGMDYRKALDEVEELGLRLMANDSTYIKEMAAGSIVVQSPAKGMSVKEGRIIYVTINSLTIPRVRIPDLIGNSGYREAQARLQALGFRVLPPKLIDGEQDLVYQIQLDGRDIHTGDMVARESQLVLVIGNGTLDDDLLYGTGELDLGPRDDSDYDDGGQPEMEDDFEPVDMEELLGL